MPSWAIVGGMFLTGFIGYLLGFAAGKEKGYREALEQAYVKEDSDE